MAKPIVISCRLCSGCWQIIPEGRCRACRSTEGAKYRAKNPHMGRAYMRSTTASKKRIPKAEISADAVRSALDYNPKTGDFSRVGKSEALGTVNPNGYIIISLFGWNFRAHRLAWFYVHGKWPTENLDHINGSRIDNRIANLREVTHSVNCQNLRAPKANNKSGFLGVLWCPKSRKWLARITVAGNVSLLGRFDRPEDASIAYIEAKRLMHEGCTI